MLTWRSKSGNLARSLGIHNPGFHPANRLRDVKNTSVFFLSTILPQHSLDEWVPPVL